VFLVLKKALITKPKFQQFFKNLSIHMRGHQKSLASLIETLCRPDMAQEMQVAHAYSKI